MAVLVTAFAFHALFDEPNARPSAVLASAMEGKTAGGSDARAVLTPPATAAVVGSLDEPATGRVSRLQSRRREGIEGVVTDRAGRPVAGALCRLSPGTPSSAFFPDDDLRSPSDAMVATTSSAGRFELDADEGYWRIAIDAEGYAPWERDHLVGDEVLEVILDLQGVVLFSVSDSDGVPVEGVQLRLLGADADRSSQFSLDATDAAGRAILARAQPGSWAVSARHPDYRLAVKRVDVPSGPGKVEERITLEHGIRITGHVRGSGEAPIPEALVVLEGRAGGAPFTETARCDDQGRYATDAVFSPSETVTIVARAPGHAESRKLVQVPVRTPSASQDVVNFTLAEIAWVVRGRVLDADGRRLPGAAVRLAMNTPGGVGVEETLLVLRGISSDPRRWRNVATTDEAGAFELRGLSADLQYVLLVTSRAFAPRIVWIERGPSGAETDLGEIRLERSGSLFGRVGREGRPAPDAEVLALREAIFAEEELDRWRPTEWWSYVDARTLPDGTFRIDGLAPGRYELRVDGSPVDAWDVHAGTATGPVEVRLPADGGAQDTTVRGTVHSDGGREGCATFVSVFSGNEEAEFLGGGLVPPTGEFQVRVPARDSYTVLCRDLLGCHHDRMVRVGLMDAREPVRVVMETKDPGPGIEGMVIDPGGLPVEGCTVSVRPREHELCGCVSFQASTDGDGLFRFAHLATGDYEVVVADPGGRFANEARPGTHPGDFVTIELKEHDRVRR